MSKLHHHIKNNLIELVYEVLVVRTPTIPKQKQEA